MTTSYDHTRETDLTIRLAESDLTEGLSELPAAAFLAVRAACEKLYHETFSGEAAVEVPLQNTRYKKERGKQSPSVANADDDTATFCLQRTERTDSCVRRRSISSGSGHAEQTSAKRGAWRDGSGSSSKSGSIADMFSVEVEKQTVPRPSVAPPAAANRVPYEASPYDDKRVTELTVRFAESDLTEGLSELPAAAFLAVRAACEKLYHEKIAGDAAVEVPLANTRYTPLGGSAWPTHPVVESCVGTDRWADDGESTSWLTKARGSDNSPRVSGE